MKTNSIKPLINVLICVPYILLCSGIIFYNCKENDDIHSQSVKTISFELNENSGFPELDKQALEISADDITDDDVKKLFYVDKKYAEKFAINFAIKHEAYESSVHTCIYLPVMDSKNTIISHYFILSQNTCHNYQNLVSLIKPYFQKATYNSKIRSQRLKSIIDMTAEDFFTIEVNAYVFEHPLKIAHKGVPRWIVQSDETAGFCNNPDPQVRYITNDHYHHEVIKYSCRDKHELYFSHYSGTQLEKRNISNIFDLKNLFMRWQQTVKNKYGSQAEQRLQFIYSVWIDFLPYKHGDLP